ncbi:MAG TPA: proprotein convertase P-domain-containing protein [Tepidisphaeraceae bacterium]|nr:proprotein convertase P-domain-containing protein [Tepidisphaeraceae bacterium]
MAVAASLRNLGRALRRSSSFNTMDCGPVLDRVTRSHRSRRQVANSIRTIVEALEPRQLMSTTLIPAPIVSDWQSISGSATTDSPTYNLAPSTAVDPTNPNRAVTVYAHNNPSANGPQKIFIEYTYTSDGGQTWQGPVDLPGDINDPQLTTTSSNIPYAQATDATVGFDRSGTFYISYSEHNTGNSGGAIMLQAYDWTGNNPVANSAINHKIIYQWVSADSAWSPTLAVDNNVASFTDPDTGDTQTDNFTGTIYIAWASQDVNSVSSPSPIDTFNPNTIRLVSAQWDDQVARNVLYTSSPQIWNANGNTGTVHGATPKIVVSQGDVVGNVPGGQVSIVWDDINSGRNAAPPVDFINVTTGTSGGGAYVASDDTPSLPINITDAVNEIFKAPSPAIPVHSPTNPANAPTQVLAGNYDADTLEDAVVLGTTSDDINILRGKGDGTFVAPVTIPASPTAATAIGFTQAIIDGDAFADLLVVDSNGVNLLTGTGSATGSPAATPPVPAWFNPAVQVFAAPAGDTLTSIAVGDFNGDGKVDFAVTDSTANTVIIMFGDGTGAFTPDPAALNGAFSTGGTGPSFVQVADMNNDNHDDLIVANTGNNQIRILMNDAAGTGDFSAGLSAPYATNDIPVALKIADLNGDNRPDVIVVTPSDVETFRNATVGPVFNLVAAATLNARPGDTFTNVIVNDLSGDTRPDLLIASSGSNRLVLAEQNANGTFTIPINANIAFYAVGTDPTGMVQANFSGSGVGQGDVLVINTGDDTATILARPVIPVPIPAPTLVAVTVNIPTGPTDPAFGLGDVDVDLGIQFASTNELLIQITAPNGNTATLIQNRNAGNVTREWVTGVDQGVSVGNLGYVAVGNQLNYVGVTFGSAVRNANDSSFSGVGIYLPEGDTYRNNQTLLELLGYTIGQAADDPINPINGTWTLSVTDEVPTATTPPPVEQITHFDVRITNNTLPDSDPAGTNGVSQYRITSTTVLGALNPNNNPRAASVSGISGIGPGIQVAADNTLGAFSPVQGRIYVTFVNRSTATGNPTDNTDVMLTWSDDAGQSWTSPERVNDDDAATDGYSEAAGPIGGLSTRGRPQFQPAIAVDQFTGTLVITYFDARQDASRTRVARYIATSNDGGDTFSPQTFLNVPNTAVDASTGKTVVLGPTPDNGSKNDDPTFGVGYEQGLAVLGGNVFATWSGNENGSFYNPVTQAWTVNDKHLPDIETAAVRITAGPRIIDSTMGPISQPGDTVNPVDPVTHLPTLTSFILTFDRPIDPSTIITTGGVGGGQNIWVYFRTPGMSGNQTGTLIPLSAIITLIDPDTHAQIIDDGQNATSVLLTFATPQTAVGTYTYFVDPTISDRIRKNSDVTLEHDDHQTITYSSDTAQSNLPVPTSGTGGTGTAADQTTSVINVSDLPASETVTDLLVTVNIQHTNASDLQITLFDPDHNAYILEMNTASGRNLSNIYSFTTGDPVVDALNSGGTRIGDWTLQIVDSVTGNTGFLLNWSLAITTSVTDSALGNAMDQDGSGIGGESAWSGQTLGDVYSVPAPTNANAWDVSTQTFHTPYTGATLPIIVPGPSLTTSDQAYAASGSNTNVAIPDATSAVLDPNNIASSSIFIGGDSRQKINSLTVTVNISHPSVDTLNVYLIAPDGTKVLLYKADPTFSDPVADLEGTTFDDNADENISAITVLASLFSNNLLGVYNGTFQPAGLVIPGNGLGQLDGKSLTGTWKLQVQDTQPDGVTGTINGWSISADTSTVITNPTSAVVGTTPSVNSIDVVFDRPMNSSLITTPGAIAGTTSPILSLMGPAGPITFDQTYSSTSSLLSIPDTNTPITSSLTVADTYNIGHIAVKFDIAHANVGDLKIVLIDPNGVAHLLVLNRGGAGHNFTGTLITDLASTSISSVTAANAPFSSSAGYKPENPLDSTLAGQNVKGTWTLQVTDSVGNAVAGVLNSWSLIATPQIVADPNFDASNPDPVGQARTFKIYLPNQAVSGQYSVTLNPAITDTFGNSLDSDHNAGLDALRDPVLSAANTLNSPTVPFTYTESVSTPIASATAPATSNTVVSTLTVPDNFTLQNLTVRINATFPNVSLLDIVLQAPDGTQVMLFQHGTGNFGTRANFTDTVFDDTATTQIQNGSAPYAGRFKPQSPLSALVTAGVNVAGDWKLIITDYSNTGVSGTINNWSITASKVVPNNGLGTASDQATVPFRIFNLDGSNTQSSNTWTPVTSSASSDSLSSTQSANSSGTTLSAGAVTDVAVDPSDPSGNTVFVASASGGIWKTTNFLTTSPQGPVYYPVTDFGSFNSLNIGSIAVFARNAQPGTTGQLSATIDPSSSPAANGLSLANVIDGSFNTYYSSTLTNNAQVVFNLGSPQYVTTVKYAPRTTSQVGNIFTIYGNSMIGGKFQGTNSLNGTWTDLYTITTAPLSGTLTSAAVTNPNYYQYVRYVGPDGFNSLVSEIQIFGNPTGTVSSGSSSRTIVVAGTGQGTAGSTLNGTTAGVITETSGSTANASGSGQISPGVGFLLSSDGGSTWNLLDSTTNVDASGNYLPIDSPLRDHIFVGTATYKVVVDPRPTPTGDTIIYAALTGTNGGLWRSLDTGKHWTLMRAGDCTDIILDYNSGTVNTLSNPTGNLNIIYAGFRGEGIFQSPNRGQTWNELLGTTGGTPGVRDGTVSPDPALTVSNPGNPDGNKGRIVLAMPSPTGDVAADIAHEGWIYAAVVNSAAGNYSGTLDGLYVTKDFGLNWTKIPLDMLGTVNGVIPPFAPSNDPNAGATENIVNGQYVPAGEGNHDLSLTVDPTNPAVIYVAGSGWATLYSVFRIDTTHIYDAHSFDTPLDASDGGQLTLNVAASVQTKNLDAIGQHNPFGMNIGSFTSPQYINLVTDPNNPFVNNATFLTSNATGFVNSGDDAWWTPIDDMFSLPTDGFHPDVQRIISVVDPLTGQTRLIMATDSGLYAAVANADGTINTGVGTASAADGSRNGNLDTAQVLKGAVQPGSLAAQLAGAMFYAMTQGDGLIVSDPNALTTGNITGSANYDPGKGSDVAVDLTGSGTAYGEFIPGLLGTDFYQVFTPGTSTGNNVENNFRDIPPTGGTSRTLGLITTTTYTGAAGDTQDDAWPDSLSFNFSVNPVNGNQIVAATFVGTVFATNNQGAFWTKIASPTDLDGSIINALTYGAPDAAAGDSTSSLIYLGSSGIYSLAGSAAQPPVGAASHGHVYVSLTGGQSWTSLDPAGLDGSEVRSIVTDPTRGSHDLYVVTDKNIYFMPDSSAPNATWTKITGNLPTGTNTWTSGLADWRYQLPNTSNSGTHPVIYIAGDSGVFRSLDNGTTWTSFPSADPTLDNAPADGGYLPSVRVTDLDLAIGNVDPTTGFTDVASGPSILLASTFGRGQYAIRVAPLTLNAAFGPNDGFGNRTVTGLSEASDYGNLVTIQVFDSANLTTPIGTGTTNADGSFSVSLTSPLVGSSVVVRAVDAANVVGPDTTIATPPDAPDAPELAIPNTVPANQDTGTSNSDGLTKTNKPTLDNHGETPVVANSLITIYVDGATSTGWTTTADSSGNWVFTFPTPFADGPHAFTITQTDPTSHLTSPQSAALDLIIDTVAPAGTAAAIPSVVKGTPLTNILLATFTDLHQVVSATVNWGDGTTDIITNLSPVDGGTFQVRGTHTYTTAGNRTVTITAIDNAGNTSSIISTSASITAPPHTFSVTSQSLTGQEGSPLSSVVVAVVNDSIPTYTTASIAATINWGDGSPLTNGTIVADGSGHWDVLGTHTYIDNRQDRPAYDVTVSVTTVDGDSQTVGSTANISNVIPTGTVSNPGAIYLGQTATLTLTANDVSSADVAAGFQYVVNWGDGTPATTVLRAAGNGSGVSLSHTFNAASSLITVSILDKDGGTRVLTTPITVKTAPVLNSFNINGNKSRSDINQITFNISNTDIAGGVSLSNLKLYYNGDGVNALSLNGASLAFDPASGNGTLNLQNLTTPLKDGDYQLQISVGGKLFVISFFRLQGDLNGDGVVDSKDGSIITSHKGQSGLNILGDLNHDGVVNQVDVNLYNKLKNDKATGGKVTLTLQTGKVGVIPTINFGTINKNSNGGYIDLVIKNTNINGVSLDIGKISLAGGIFTFALPGLPWGPAAGSAISTIAPNKTVTIRVYLKNTTKVKTQTGKLLFSFATTNKRDYNDVTIPLKAIIAAAPVTSAIKKAVKKK